MSVKEVMNLAPGAIIELAKDAGDDLDVLINNKNIGAGRAVKVGENFGVRVTRIGTLPARIRALGQGGGRNAAASDIPEELIDDDDRDDRDDRKVEAGS